MDKVACSQCGVMILARTAMRYDGKCILCSNGTRASMEESRRWHREHLQAIEREEPDPAVLCWASLVGRVYKTEAGFEGLSEDEKKYFAVCCCHCWLRREAQSERRVGAGRTRCHCPARFLHAREKLVCHG
jgi:hypothetical protein